MHSNCLKALTGSTFNGQEPNRRRSTAACKMLCRAHWRCIGCFQIRAACRGLALLLLGVLVLRSAKQACVQPSKSRAHEASAGLYVPSTQLDTSQSNCLIGVNHHRHDVPVSQQRNSPQKMAQSAYDYPQVVSAQTLITEAASYGPAGHLYPSETQLLETRCVNLSQGTVLMKAASERDGRCSQQRLSTEGSPLPERRTNMSLSLSNRGLAVCCEIGGLTLPVRSSTVSNNEASHQHTLSGLHARGTEGISSPARPLSASTDRFQHALSSGWLRWLEGSASPVRPLLALCTAGKHDSSLCVPRSWLMHQSAQDQPGTQQWAAYCARTSALKSEAALHPTGWLEGCTSPAGTLPVPSGFDLSTTSARTPRFCSIGGLVACRIIAVTGKIPVLLTLLLARAQLCRQLPTPLSLHTYLGVCCASLSTELTWRDEGLRNLPALGKAGISPTDYLVLWLATFSNAPLCQFMPQVRTTKFMALASPGRLSLLLVYTYTTSQLCHPAVTLVLQVAATTAGALTAHLSAMRLRSLCWSVILLPASSQAELFQTIRLEWRICSKAAYCPERQIGFPNTVTAAIASVRLQWNRLEGSTSPLFGTEHCLVSFTCLLLPVDWVSGPGARSPGLATVQARCAHVRSVLYRSLEGSTSRSSVHWRRPQIGLMTVCANSLAHPGMLLTVGRLCLHDALEGMLPDVARFSAPIDGAQPPSPTHSCCVISRIVSRPGKSGACRHCLRRVQNDCMQPHARNYLSHALYVASPLIPEPTDLTRAHVTAMGKKSKATLKRQGKRQGKWQRNHPEALQEDADAHGDAGAAASTAANAHADDGLLPVQAPLGYRLRFGYRPLRDPLRRMMTWHLHYITSSLFHLLHCLNQSWMPQR